MNTKVVILQVPLRQNQTYAFESLPFLKNKLCLSLSEDLWKQLSKSTRIFAGDGAALEDIDHNLDGQLGAGPQGNTERETVNLHEVLVIDRTQRTVINISTPRLPQDGYHTVSQSQIIIFGRDEVKNATSNAWNPLDILVLDFLDHFLSEWKCSLEDFIFRC
jgi:hypothetical protein